MSSLLTYQTAAKSAKAAYFSSLILNNQNKPKFLFSVINAVLNSSVICIPNPSNEIMCNNFYKQYIV